MNYVDIIICVLLALAFFRGFSSGLWKALMNLIVNLAAFLGAYFLTGPVLRFVDAKYGLIAKMSVWAGDVMPNLPGSSLPYDPETFGRVFNIVGTGSWVETVRSVVQKYMASSAVIAGPNATWGDVVATSVAHLLASGIVFVALFGLLTVVLTIMSSSLSWALPASFGIRVLGGLVQSAVSALWLSVVAGTIYPLITAGFLQGARDAAATSWLMSFLLGVYRTIWPAVVARLS